MRHIDESTSHVIRFSYNRMNYILQENKIRYMEKMLRKIRIVANKEFECYGKFEDIQDNISSCITGLWFFGCKLQSHNYRAADPGCPVSLCLSTLSTRSDYQNGLFQTVSLSEIVCYE